jgi:hypothetical protein
MSHELLDDTSQMYNSAPRLVERGGGGFYFGNISGAQRVRCSRAHFKSGTSIQHLTEAPILQRTSFTFLPWWEGLLIKLTAAAGCEMDVPDLKCAREHRTPLSTRYVPFYFIFILSIVCIYCGLFVYA